MGGIVYKNNSDNTTLEEPDTQIDDVPCSETLPHIPGIVYAGDVVIVDTI